MFIVYTRSKFHPRSTLCKEFAGYNGFDVVLKPMKMEVVIVLSERQATPSYE